MNTSLERQKKPAVGWHPSGGQEKGPLVSDPVVITKRVDQTSKLKIISSATAKAILKFESRLDEALEFPAGHSKWLCAKIGRCSSWLKLIQTTATKVRVADGNFCQTPLLCPACAAVRSRRLCGRYFQRLKALGDGACNPYLLTLTVPSPVSYAPESVPLARAERDTLIDASGKIMHAWRKLWARRKAKDAGPLRFVQGAVVSLEVTHTNNGWHPHLHGVLLMPRGVRVDVRELRSAWEHLTGGHQIRIDPIRKDEDGLKGVVEALKYTVKVATLENGEMGSEDAYWRFLAYSALKGRRLTFGYGSLFGIPDGDLEDESEDDDEFEIEWWFRWNAARFHYDRCSGYTEAISPI